MATDSGARLGRLLGYRFADPALAAAALVHRSVGGASNERLEFLGDAVIALAVAEWLYMRHPDLAEGDLTRLRASLVKRDSLAGLARELDLGSLIELGDGERRSGGSARRSILEDSLEAAVGAVFLDGGYDAAREVMHRLFADRFANLPDAESLKDAKTRLQERLQARGLALPDYALVATQGPEHARCFEVECRIEARGLAATGAGASKRAAEQAAAAAALALLDH
ncbi:MAG: ribonuclease III [Gammaproteobacteria bacterium]